MGLNYQAAGCQTETRKGGKLPTAESIFMRVSEVAEELGVSQSYAYKLVRQLNKELAETGCIIIPGRIDRKFFHEKGSRSVRGGAARSESKS